MALNVPAIVPMHTWRAREPFARWPSDAAALIHPAGVDSYEAGSRDRRRPACARVLRDALRARGYDVVLAHTAAAGITLARKRREVAELLRRAEAADREEDAQYGLTHGEHELPAELARRESRLRKIAEVKAALEAEARAAAAAHGRTWTTRRRRIAPSGTLPTRDRRSGRPATASSKATERRSRSTSMRR